VTDQKRLIEIAIEGQEPFRKWRQSNYEESLKEGRQRLAKIQTYLPKILNSIDQFEDEAIALLQKLIRTQSINSSPEGEKEIAKIVAQELERNKFVVDSIEPETSRVSVVGNRTFGGKYRPKVVFYGHLDTVPAGSLSEWSHPPFAAELIDGKIVGRGAQDCKMGVASSILSAKILSEMNIDLRGTISVAAAADEESGGHKGIHELIQAGLLNGDYGVYVESIPSEIHVAHNGMVWLKVTTKGESAHSSKKKLFPNAILKMSKVIQALDNLEFTRWNQHPLVPGGPYISVNKIQGGTKENMIPDECGVICDIRTMPGQTLASVLADVERTLNCLRAEDPLLKVQVEVLTYARSGEIPPSDPAVVFTQLAAEQIIGIMPKAVGVTALTDQRWALYDAGLPMVIYSCGTPTWHMPNEYILVRDYLNTIKILCIVALMFLSGESHGVETEENRTV
jgi:succinyl-diaminopimelate desuccinylase